MKICIIQAGTSNFSGSFIKAHQELIGADKVILHGPTHDFRHKNRSVSLFEGLPQHNSKIISKVAVDK